MSTLFAEQLTAPAFAAFVNARTVGVLPVAAIEPHGPHLPLATDAEIARGHLAHVEAHVEEAHDVLVLPLQTVGSSVEHEGFPGVFSHDPETLLAAWGDIVRPFYEAGGRRLIVISSHGGNSEVVGILVQRLRARLGMLAVSASWLRFGQPEGPFDPEEITYGMHGGDVETSLMLHYRPELVRLEELRDFTSAARGWDASARHLKAFGRTRLGWMTRDFNEAGVVGDARAASADKGALSAAHALRGFAELVADVAAFDLARLKPADRP